MGSGRSNPGHTTVVPAEGVGVLKSGGVCVIDFHVNPGEDRRSATSVGQRKAG